jgi:hypothetical protein
MSMSEIQANLKCAKSQFNSFGKYKYRSCEDIVEAVKPILSKYGYHLTMSDEVVGVGDRVYIKATCCVMNDDKEVAKSTALAREALIKKGMDDSQITGTASSYARKYALNGLFAIDDTKDADSDEHQAQSGRTVQPPRESAKSIAVDVWESLSEEEQIFLNDIAVEMVSEIDDENLEGACKLFYEQNLTQEEQTALWSRLGSKERASIKKFRDEQRKAA